MIAFPAGVKVWIAGGVTDMRVRVSVMVKRGFVAMACLFSAERLRG